MKTLRARNRTEAKAERDVFLSKQRRGDIPAPTKVTLAECVEVYLLQLDGLVLAGEKAERTVQRYREHLTMHVVPKIRSDPDPETADPARALAQLPPGTHEDQPSSTA